MIFFKRNNNNAYKQLTQADLGTFFTRFGISNSYAKTGFGTGEVSEGVFIVKSLINDQNHSLSWCGNLPYMHFSNKKLSQVNMSTMFDNFGLSYDNTAGWNGNIPISANYSSDSFNTSIQTLYPNTVIEGSFNTHAMYFANNPNEEGLTGTVKCNIDSFTNDNEHDLWSHNNSGVTRDMPAIVKYRDRGEQHVKVSHVQQASFIINAINTDLTKIGTTEWKKEPKVFYETISDYTLPIGDPADISEYDQTGANYHQLYRYSGAIKEGTTSAPPPAGTTYNDKSGSDKPLMLDIIVKTGTSEADPGDRPNFIFGVSEVGPTSSYNFNRTPLPVFDYSGDSVLTQSKAFRPDTGWHLHIPTGVTGLNQMVLDDKDYLMCVPVIFSKLSTTPGSYGYGGTYHNNANSYKDIFGLANLAATSFGGNYNKFVIYRNANANTFTLSYAIDLRNISTGSTKAGQTVVSIASNSTDVLLIAHQNIYVISTLQVQNFIHDVLTD